MMSIRNKFLLLFVLLLSLLIGVQTWLFYRYTDEVAEKIGETAFEVSRDTASVFVFNQKSFHENKVITYQQDGKLHQRTLVTPVTKDIKIRLSDDSSDNIIKIISPSEEFQVPIPRRPFEDGLSGLKSKMLWITLSLFVGLILVAAYIIYNMTRPLRALSATAQKISQGELGAKVDLENTKVDKEFSQTLEQFNLMSDKLVDLSQQKEQQRELEHFRELSDISRGLAHNLRNPLNTLLLSIEQLALEQANSQLEAAQKSEQKAQLKKLAHKQIQRIDEWIKNFMLLMEQGLSPQEHQLNSIIEQAISQSTNPQNIQWIEFEKQQDYTLLCVESELCMILQVVIQNAIEANSEQQPIQITSMQAPEQVSVTISDQGTGIDPAILEDIFTPYVTNKTFGTGMGLYLAQRILKHRYQGKIEIAFNKPQGTLVTIRFNRHRQKHDEI